VVGNIDFLIKNVGGEEKKEDNYIHFDTEEQEEF